MAIQRIDEDLRKLLPPMPDGLRKALKQSISEKGIVEPVIVWAEKSLIIDGCYRYEIALELGIPFERIPVHEMSFPNENAAKQCRIETNLVRRQMNVYQRIILMDANRSLYEAEAKERQGKRNDITEKKRESGKPKEEPTEFKPNTKEDVVKAYRQKEDSLTAKEQEMANRVSRKIRRENETNFKLAQQIGVSETTYRHALYIRDSHNEEIIKAVESGEMAIGKAYKLLKAEPNEIQSELDRTKAGINRAMTQIREVYEWVLAHQFEFEGEVVTEKIHGMLKDGLETLEDIALGFESMQLQSDTGIISVVEELANGTEGMTLAKSGLRPFSPMKRIK